ncbi:hypothetical protein HPB50_008472 [Hyalomma asiaticum]|uniref:Uncharacterized protein n=1 Tax=Hyalomma asiaticum TaxID=266040 RepID=A0ACB7TEJ7_HYAAI|nr:hypothetical protein HPB50_008472 [Hyalomma asiaticum]
MPVVPSAIVLSTNPCGVSAPPDFLRGSEREADSCVAARATQSDIAEALGVTQATVNRILPAFRDKGRIGDAARNCVRKATEREDAALVAVGSANPLMTSGQVRDAAGIGMSTELVPQRLPEAGLKN